MFRSKKNLVAAGLLAFCMVGATLAVDKRPDSPGPGSSSEELVAAARQVYEAQLRERPIDPNRVRLDELYVWSKRWMTAEWDLSLQSGVRPKGVKAHLDRMREIEATTTMLQQAGAASAVDVGAAKYYRTEAELMHARAGG